MLAKRLSLEDIADELNRMKVPTTSLRCGRRHHSADSTSRFSLRQPPARLLAMICLNIAVSAGALMCSPWRMDNVRALLFSWPPVMIPAGSGTMAPS